MRKISFEYDDGKGNHFEAVRVSGNVTNIAVGVSEGLSAEDAEFDDDEVQGIILGLQAVLSF